MALSQDVSGGVWFLRLLWPGQSLNWLKLKLKIFNSARVRPRNGFPFINNNFTVAQSAKLWHVIRQKCK